VFKRPRNLRVPIHFIINFVFSGTSNSEIRYSLMVSDPIHDNFTVDSVLGVLQPKYLIDFEKLPLPSKAVGKLVGSMRAIGMFVEAHDLGVPSLSSQVPVIIYVEDENDHAPHFEQSFYHASVLEDLTPGSIVLQVSTHYRRYTGVSFSCFYKMYANPHLLALHYR